MSTVYPPYIIERSSRGEKTYDIFSRLLMDRIVFLGSADQRRRGQHHHRPTPVPRADNPEKDIYCTSTRPAGACRAAWPSTTRCSILGRPSNTICMGMAASHGCRSSWPAGAPGKRSALPLAHHDPPAVRRDAGNGVGHRDSGQGDPLPPSNDERPVSPSSPGSRSSRIERDMDRDRFMSADGGEGIRTDRQVLEPQKARRATAPLDGTVLGAC